jgi:hypothetical protein
MKAISLSTTTLFDQFSNIKIGGAYLVNRKVVRTTYDRQR